MIRAFLAVLLEEPLREAFRSLQDSLKKRLAFHQDRSVRVQWVHPATLHLTLKFLGDIEEGQREEIKRVLGPVVERSRALTVDFTHLGVFPDANAPRVLWVGARPDPSVTALIELATAADQALVPLGFEAERRPFQPHLTLARIKAGERSFGQALRRSGVLDHDAPVGSCAVGRIHLMRSELRPTGPVYSALWALELSPKDVSG